MNDKVKNKLLELENTANDFWNITPDAGNFLNLLIKLANYKNIVEVGTSNGYSAIWTANALQYTDGHLVTMEFYEKRVEMAVENLEYCDLKHRVTTLQGCARLLLETLTADFFPSHAESSSASHDRFIDLAFIDACKKQYIDYLRLIDPKLRQGGMIIADNVTSHAESVKDFMEAIQNDPTYQTSLLPFGGGLLLGLKTGNSSTCKASNIGEEMNV